MSQPTSFCVIGSGAMGCLYGGRLAAAGFSVALVDTWIDHVDAINAGGLVLDRGNGRQVIPVTATTDASTVDPVDVVIIFVDANSTREAGVIAMSILSPDGVVLTLQNGIGNFEALADAIGEERVLAGLSFSSAAVAGPGHTIHTHEGPTWLGERDGHRSERIEMLNAAFERAELNPIVVDNIVSIIWDKWILNCSINAICAVTGLRQGEIPRTPAVEEFQDRILDELFAVAAAKGIRLSDPNLRSTIKSQCWKKFNKPSMLQHIEAGKRTEIDALNRAAVRFGRASGIPTPYNDALSLLVKGVESASRQAVHEAPIDYDELERLAAAQT
jgi:2-dehydropantoate 2-reductase